MKNIKTWAHPNSDGMVFNLSDGAYISKVLIITSGDETYSLYVGHVVTEGDKIIYVGKEDLKIDGSFEKINKIGKFLTSG